MPFMRRPVLLATMCVPLLVAPLTAPAEAGPVQRRLESLGGNVPVPGTRPETPQTADDSDTADSDNDTSADAEQEPATNADEATDAEPPEVDEKPEPEPEKPPVIPPIKPAVTLAPKDAPPLPEVPEDAPLLEVPTCVERLRAIADVEVSDQPLDADPVCVVEEPVILRATKGDYPVTFAKDLLLSCDFALRLARFTSDTIQPLARHHIGAKLTELGSGKGFVCRSRNGGASKKWSEHSFGRAIDITSFSFDGKDPLPVRDAADMSNARAAFLNATRRAACGTFTTILGPGSNAAHATHLHFDTGRMKPGKEHPYRICE